MISKIFLLSFFSVAFATKPKLMPFQSDKVEVIQNITYPLSCILISGSKPVFFKWFHNGIPVTESRNTMKIDNLEQLSSLSLLKVQIADAGKYDCQVQNQFGSDSISTAISVKGLTLDFSFDRHPKRGAMIFESRQT